METDTTMNTLPYTTEQMDSSRLASPKRVVENGLEIVEDLVELMTFQKLNCGPRCDNSSSFAVSMIEYGDNTLARSRKSRTNATQGRCGNFDSKATDAAGTLPRKQSCDGSGCDNRRKRSFSMCESDEDDELASLSSTASYHSSSKHQKLRDDFEDDQPQYMTSDSIYWASSVSSASMNSSNSSMSEYTLPLFTPGLRLALPKVSFPVAGSYTPNGSGTAPSSSSRSSPRSSTSTPRTGPSRPLPSVFKRAQSDGEVLLRNSASQRELHTDFLTPDSYFTTANVVPMAADEKSNSSSPVSTPSSSDAPPAAARLHSHHLSRPGSGRSVSSSSLPTTFRSSPLSSAGLSSSSSAALPVMFSSTPIAPLSSGLIKPIAISPPSRRPRRPTLADDCLPSAFTSLTPISQSSASESPTP